MKIRELPKTESPRKQLENEEYHANYQGPRTRKLEFHRKKKKTKITQQKKKIRISSKAEKIVRLFLIIFFFFFFFLIIRGFVSCLFKGKKGSSEVTSQVISE